MSSASFALSPLTVSATAAACFAAGYYAATLRQATPAPTASPAPRSEVKPKTEPAPESEDEDEAFAAANKDQLSSLSAGFLEECKLVLCVRTDLGMNKGKIAAQASHATLACYKTISKSNPSVLKAWERAGQAKIALKVDSEDEMLLLEAQAASLGLVARVIQDAGRTQIAAGSRTVLGIGPGPVSVINQVTGHLKLL